MVPNRSARPGFTLIELLIAMGIIGVISSIVLVAINPTKQLCEVHEATRIVSVREVEKAIYYFLIDRMAKPATTIPLGEANAKPICRRGVTTDATCVNLDVLTPDFLADLPVDEEETNANYTGYLIYEDDHSRLYVLAAYTGECDRVTDSSESSVSSSSSSSLFAPSSSTTSSSSATYSSSSSTFATTSPSSSSASSDGVSSAWSSYSFSSSSSQSSFLVVSSSESSSFSLCNLAADDGTWQTEVTSCVAQQPRVELHWQWSTWAATANLYRYTSSVNGSSSSSGWVFVQSFTGYPQGGLGQYIDTSVSSCMYYHYRLSYENSCGESYGMYQYSVLAPCCTASSSSSSSSSS